MAGKIVLTACSDARKESDRAEICELKRILEGYGFEVCLSRYLYDDEALGKDKAEEFNSLLYSDKISNAGAISESEIVYKTDKLAAIIDVSGGNVANELLPYLDYKAIAGSSCLFFGYSDLTTIINAIYAKTGKASVLYQARHLVGNKERQWEMGELLSRIQEIVQGDVLYSDNDVTDTMALYKSEILCENNLIKPEYHYVQGSELYGTLIGGNLRCFLKLAGTEYMPEFTDKVFLMEALGGDMMSARSMLSQLMELGVFDSIRGIVVGTFTELIRHGDYDRFLGLLRSYIPDDMPVVVTKDIGHGRDAKCIFIGREINFNKGGVHHEC